MANLIITCGTSQIEKELLNLVNKYLPRAQRLRFSDFDRTDAPVAVSTYHHYRQNDAKVKTISKALQEQWKDREILISRDENPFGAELSTLILMAKEGYWSPKTDSIHFLASETRAGVTCAAIIAEILSGKVEVPDAQIHFQIAANVKERAPSPDGAQRSLAHSAFNAFQEAGNNLLVITGGFKSMIPAMALTAFVFGLPMYYLYEDGHRLQEFYLVKGLDDDSARNYWMDIWKKMANESFASTTPLLRDLLEKRIKHRGVNFGPN